MSTDPEVRIRGVQLPLPLPEPAVDGGADTAPVGEEQSDDAGWRLDEHTRRVGIQGIAAARARLRAGSGRAA